MGRHANPDIRRAFTEFRDDDTPTKCSRVRCVYCGYARAKNTTRQIEHLQGCHAFLNSPEAVSLGAVVPDDSPATALQSQGGHDGAPGGGTTLTGEGSSSAGATRAMLNGTHPNPNLQINRRGPNQKRNRDGQLVFNSNTHTPTVGVGGHGHHGHHPHSHHHPPPPPPPPPPVVSLAAHLLNTNAAAFTAATQSAFLSHAGCGTLSAGPLLQWLVQDSHLARGVVRFLGQMLAKLRLPAMHAPAPALPPGPHPQPQQPQPQPHGGGQSHLLYRTLDLLISALNNVRREMGFFDITATKYGLPLRDDPPNPVSRAYQDLFLNASSAGASLLEGMVVLWATLHCHRTSWTHAATFATSLHHPPTTTAAVDEAHTLALHQALIPNWTSPQTARFVDAARALVDELANSSAAANGREEARRCDELFRQVCWLSARVWPDVDGMGEEDESAGLARAATAALGSAGGAGQGSAAEGGGGGNGGGSGGGPGGRRSGEESPATLEGAAAAAVAGEERIYAAGGLLNGVAAAAAGDTGGQ